MKNEMPGPVVPDLSAAMIAVPMGRHLRMIREIERLHARLVAAKEVADAARKAWHLLPQPTIGAGLALHCALERYDGAIAQAERAP